MNKYLLIDGNNLAVRASFANQGLSTSDGIPTGVHFGFMQSLVKLKGLFHDCKFLIGEPFLTSFLKIPAKMKYGIISFARIFVALLLCSKYS
jgi:hypothetical protein